MIIVQAVDTHASRRLLHVPHALFRGKTLHKLDLASRRGMNMRSFEWRWRCRTHLLFRYGPEFSGRGGLTGDSANGNLDSLANLAPSGNPIADLSRNDFDDGNTRVILVALVNAVSQVAKPGCGATNTIQ